MTPLFDGFLALLLAIIWTAFIISRIHASFPGAEGRFLTRVYTATLGLRFALALFLNVYGEDFTFAQNFWGDSTYYDSLGHLVATAWAGETAMSAASSALKVSAYGFVYFVATIYYIFGRNQMLVQFINGTIGALAMLVIYAIARDLFDSQVARWAAYLMAFFPQMIFWSAAMYKDPAIILCIALCMYAISKLRHSFGLGYLLLFLASSLALMSLRFYIFYFVAFASVGTFLFAQKRRAVASLAGQLALLGIFLAAFSFAVDRDEVTHHRSYFELERVQVSRSDLARSARSGFAAEADVSTPMGALSAVPVGVLYLMFAPFPWAVSGVRQALTVPETLVWYALMPSLVRGLYYTVRHRLRDALPILVFAISLTLAYAIFQGNVGTAYRQRTQISMFYFIFMGVGLEQRRRARAKQPEPQASPYLPAAYRR